MSGRKYAWRRENCDVGWLAGSNGRLKLESQLIFRHANMVDNDVGELFVKFGDSDIIQPIKLCAAKIPYGDGYFFLSGRGGNIFGRCRFLGARLAGGENDDENRRNK